MAIIDKPTDHFITNLRSGVYAGSGVTNFDIGFQPDLIIDKVRTTTGTPDWVDSVRGANKALKSSNTNAENPASNITDFLTNGFEITNFNDWGSGESVVDWCWKAGGTAVSNTDGSITSSVSANTDSGFSICTYTGTGVSETIGHGLGAVPNVIIVKGRSGPDAVDGWYIYHSSVGNTKFLELNSTGASTTNSSLWDNTTPTSITFSTTYLSKASTNYVAYCFADTSMIKCGSYTGNGSTDGTFVYTGFKPAFVLRKSSSIAGYWNLHDNKRDTYNLAYLRLFPNENWSEATSTDNSLDILSNGFKCRATNTDTNGSGSTYIYLAIAEQSFVTSTTNGSIPATAR